MIRKRRRHNTPIQATQQINLLWIVVLPLYLLSRKKIIDIAVERPQVVPSFRRYTIIGLIAATFMLLLWAEYA